MVLCVGSTLTFLLIGARVPSVLQIANEQRSLNVLRVINIQFFLDLAYETKKKCRYPEDMNITQRLMRQEEQPRSANTKTRR